MTSFNLNNESLELIYNQKVVFVFDKSKPAFYVGSGETDFKMSRGSFKITEKSSQKIAVKAKSFSLDGNKAVINANSGKIIIEAQGDLFKFTPVGFERYNRFAIKIPSHKNEYVYGGGELFTEFNLKGKKINIWVAEHNNVMHITDKMIRRALGVKNSVFKHDISKYETYYSQPTFISSEKYFYHSLASEKVRFDFSHSDYHLIKTDAVAPFYIGFGEDYEKLMFSLSELLGRQPELPDWVYDGMILGVQGGTDTMLRKLETAKLYGLDINGIWIQDWEGRRVTQVGKQLNWNWIWDSELYPNLDNEIKRLNEKGVKILGYVNPFLAVEKSLYKEASEKGYCVKDKNGDDYLVTITTFPAAMVDLTNPEAYEWIKSIIKKNMIEFGLSGWMADFAEYLPADCVLYSGEDATKVHNSWPALWAKANREAVEESGKLGEIFFFTRSGSSGTPKYSTMMWCGDNHVDFSLDFGLPTVIPAMLSLTCSGFGLSHSDIGGYTSFFNLKRSEETYMRWCEMNAFSPLMRGHEGLNPDINAQFDNSQIVLEHGAKMTAIHKKLAPYLKQAVKYNAEKGVGVVRPLFFYYDEKPAYEQMYEYLLGRDLLVAPVLKEGARSRKVYLPDDTWIHLESGNEYSGGTYEIEAELGEIPVFVRKNADENVINLVKNIF